MSRNIYNSWSDKLRLKYTSLIVGLWRQNICSCEIRVNLYFVPLKLQLNAMVCVPINSTLLSWTYIKFSWYQSCIKVKNISVTFSRFLCEIRENYKIIWKAILNSFLLPTNTRLWTSNISRPHSHSEYRYHDESAFV